jgi:hypothetical protein
MSRAVNSNVDEVDTKTKVKTVGSVIQQSARKAGIDLKLRRGSK